MSDIEKLFIYLKKKNSNFQKTTKKGQVLFTCPQEVQHKYRVVSPTCTLIPGSDKFYCLQCAWKGTIYDIIRTIEQKNLTNEEIMTFLNKTLQINPYADLELYKQYNWSLIPIATNGKNPIEKAWTEKTHYEQIEWIKWLESGFNIGVQTGKVSEITVIDVDLKEAPDERLEEVYKLLIAANTLTQNSPHGKHFIFKYDSDLQTGVGIGGITVDIRNDGAQILIAPSKINALTYHWCDNTKDIQIVTEEIKAKLLTLSKVDSGRTQKMSVEMSQAVEQIKIVGEGGRNDLLVSIGGILIKILKPEQVEMVLNIINQKFMSPSLPGFEIKAMLGSLAGYKETEEQTQENAILECANLLQHDISAKDIMEHTGLKRALVDKYLAKLFKEGKLVRRSRGRYDIKQKVEWTNETQEKTQEYQYKIPYFNDIAYFHTGDIVLIGAPTGKGKTTIAMNIVKQMREQGVTPFYISLESGSRHEKTAKLLGLSIADYYISKDPIDDPLQIEIEPESFTIIDWLYTGEDFAATQSIFKHLSDEMRRRGGILLVFTQLKEDYNYFAVNLIKSFARFACRFIYDDDTGIMSHFQIDKITDPKGHYQWATIPCEFNFDTKELKKKENL